MFDNAQDKGYLQIRLKQIDGVWNLCPVGIFQAEDESDFYVDYENGTLFVDFGDGTKKTIGYYDTTVDDVWLAKVYDNTKTRVIGRVGQELIYFRAREADASVGRYMPDEECLVTYTQNGSIVPPRMVPTMGYIHGSEIGGAAAFVAVFNSFNFKSVYCDYFEMDDAVFKETYNSYLHPYGF